jgi:hypothetical protein
LIERVHDATSLVHLRQPYAVAVATTELPAFVHLTREVRRRLNTASVIE